MRVIIRASGDMGVGFGASWGKEKKGLWFRGQMVDSRWILEVTWKYKIKVRGQGKVCGHVEL